MRGRSTGPSTQRGCPTTFRNDSGRTPQQVMEKLRHDGVEIKYGDIAMLAEQRMLDEAREHVRQQSPEERRYAMRSVDRALRSSVKKVLKGTASKKRMDDFHADLLLWTALSEQSAS